MTRHHLYSDRRREHNPVFFDPEPEKFRSAFFVAIQRTASRLRTKSTASSTASRLRCRASAAARRRWRRWRTRTSTTGRSPIFRRRRGRPSPRRRSTGRASGRRASRSRVSSSAQWCRSRCPRRTRRRVRRRSRRRCTSGARAATSGRARCRSSRFRAVAPAVGRLRVGGVEPAPGVGERGVGRSAAAGHRRAAAAAGRVAGRAADLRGLRLLQGAMPVVGWLER